MNITASWITVNHHESNSFSLSCKFLSMHPSHSAHLIHKLTHRHPPIVSSCHPNFSQPQDNLDTHTHTHIPPWMCVYAWVAHEKMDACTTWQGSTLSLLSLISWFRWLGLFRPIIFLIYSFIYIFLSPSFFSLSLDPLHINSVWDEHGEVDNLNRLHMYPDLVSSEKDPLVITSGRSQESETRMCGKAKTV